MNRFRELAGPDLGSIGGSQTGNGSTGVHGEDRIAVVSWRDPFRFADPIASDELTPDDFSGSDFDSYYRAFDAQDGDFIGEGIDLIANAT